MPILEALPNTPQWVAARRGCLTASRFGDATKKQPMKLKKNLQPYKNSGKYSASRRTYAIEVVSERVADYAVDHYVSDPMRDGIEFEPMAADAYEAERGVILGPSGFYLHDRIQMFGATPDRFVGRDGLIQIKVPVAKNFVDLVMADALPEEHIPQMLAELAVTGRKWNDLVAFNPFIKRGPRLFIKRFEPTAAQIREAEDEAEKFLAEVDQMFELFTTGGLEDTLKRSLTLVKGGAP
jgi:hypothetical protein